MNVYRDTIWLNSRIIFYIILCTSTFIMYKVKSFYKIYQSISKL